MSSASVAVMLKCMAQGVKSEKSERIWHYLHLDVGTIAIANWYRSPSGDDEQIVEFNSEIAELKDEVLGFIVMGDLNIHHRRWLKYSNDNSHQGSLLKQNCDDHAFKQLIHEPTRGEYLLDLVLTDLESCKAEITQKILL